MIGPQAYENLFQTAPNPKSYALLFNYEGKEYMYMYDWEVIGWYGFKGFLTWCAEDIMERNGEYADSVEVVE